MDGVIHSFNRCLSSTAWWKVHQRGSRRRQDPNHSCVTGNRVLEQIIIPRLLFLFLCNEKCELDNVLVRNVLLMYTGNPPLASLKERELVYEVCVSQTQAGWSGAAGTDRRAICTQPAQPTQPTLPSPLPPHLLLLHYRSVGSVFQFTGGK